MLDRIATVETAVAGDAAADERAPAMVVAAAAS
jgi:hypothetical protein